MPCSCGSSMPRPDRDAAGLACAAVGRLHDAGAAAGDDREAVLGEPEGELARLLVHRVRGVRARGAEDAHRRAQARERIEAVDELAHDAQRPPRVGLEERGVRIGPPHQQLAVLGGPTGPGSCAVAHRGAGYPGAAHNRGGRSSEGTGVMPIIERHIRIDAPIEHGLGGARGRPRAAPLDARPARHPVRDARAAGRRARGGRHRPHVRARPVRSDRGDRARLARALRHPAPGRVPRLGRVPAAALEDGRATHVRWREELRPTPDAFPLVPPLAGCRWWAARRGGRRARSRGWWTLFAPIFTAVFRADLRRLKRLVETGAV